MRRFATLFVGAGIIAACFWSGLWWFLGAEVAPARGSGAPADATTSARPPTEVGTPVRREVPDAGELPDAGIAAGRIDFDEAVDQLVALGVAMWRAVQIRDEATVQARNQEATALLARLGAARRDAGELALDRLTRVPEDRAAIEIEVRRQVLQRVMRDALFALHAGSAGSAERGPLEALVEAMLATIPQSATIATQVGLGLLADEPYLGPAHEQSVLDLAELVPEAPFLENVVAGLLRTLWRNLEASGARTSGRLASLAMLFLEDANPARRQAAARQLVADPRYRDFAIAQVVRAGDRGLAAELARTAAVELPPAEALAILRAVDEVGGDELTAAYLVLGDRDGRLMAREYEQVLADGVRPQLRASLITGATAALDQDAFGIARLAFDFDPDPQVRIRALYALAMQPDHAAAEAALAAAIDDPLAASDRTWIGNIALALRNLAGQGAIQALDRLGRRLEQHPMLAEHDRRALRQLLAEHLPERRRGGP
jgi:hypothetical protein